MSSTTRMLSLSFPYLEPKSCPIIVLSIKRPDIQANPKTPIQKPTIKSPNPLRLQRQKEEK